MDATHNQPPKFPLQMYVKRNAISYIHFCKEHVVFWANVCVFASISWIHQDDNFTSRLLQRLHCAQRLKCISHVFHNKTHIAVDWRCAAHVALDRWLDGKAGIGWWAPHATLKLRLKAEKIRTKWAFITVKHNWLRLPSLNTYRGEDQAAFPEFLMIWVRWSALTPLWWRKEEIARRNFWSCKWCRTSVSSNSNVSDEDMRSTNTVSAHFGPVGKKSALRWCRIPPLLALREVRDEVNLAVDRRETSEYPWVFWRIGRSRRTLKPFTTQRVGTMKISLWYGRLCCWSGRCHGGGGVFSKKWWTQKKTNVRVFILKGDFGQKITSICQDTRPTFDQQY